MLTNPLVIALLGLLSLTIQAQTTDRRPAPPAQWHHLNPTTDKTSSSVCVLTIRSSDSLN